LQGQTVVSTGCVTGTSAFAKAFLVQGANTYIAPKGYPEASATLLFAVNFYYFLLVKKLSVKQAYQKVIRLEPKEFDFELFVK
jgi:hypothetical protein